MWLTVHFVMYFSSAALKKVNSFAQILWIWWCVLYMTDFLISFYLKLSHIALLILYKNKAAKHKNCLTQAPLPLLCFHWQRRQCVGNEGPGASWTLDRQTSWARTCDWESGWCFHRNGHRCSTSLVAGEKKKEDLKQKKA